MTKKDMSAAPEAAAPEAASLSGPTGPKDDAGADAVANADADIGAANPEADAAAAAKTKRIALLTRLVADIEARRGPSQLPLLMVDLEELEDARFADKRTHWVVEMAGLSVTCTSGPGNALGNWCNKARRTLLELEAV